MKIIRAEELLVGMWSGGTTTELFIYPDTADYRERNFDFRISTATVAVETSDFTPLPGVKRTLMVLDGAMKLMHEGQHTADLKPFDFDVFEGGWNTKSIGKCTDFNLMCRGETEGNLKYLSLMGNEEKQMAPDGDRNFIYVYKGSVECEGILLNEGDLLIVDGKAPFSLHAMQQSDMVLVTVFNL